MTNGFRIVESDAQVLALGDRQSVFEPKGEYAERRTRLREALRRMHCMNPYLVATCGAPAGTLGDLENWLLYNVGFSYFQEASRGGLMIQRELEPRTIEGATYPHWWWYANSDELPKRKGQSVAEIDLRANRWPTKAAGWWRLATDSGWSRLSAYPSGASLGLNIEISTPGSLLTVLKPMVDGILCALHEYPGEPGEELVRRIAASATLDANAVRQRLSPSCTSLGARAFVWPFGGDLQWSPDDDRLHWLRIERVDAADSHVMRAELLAV